jgi:hypothetical protein
LKLVSFALGIGNPLNRELLDSGKVLALAKSSRRSHLHVQRGVMVAVMKAHIGGVS